jgi:hypothetical protein
MTADDCYYGASAGAYFNVMAAFGYHMVTADREGVNLFFVHEAVVGDEPLLSLKDVKRLSTGGREHNALHGECRCHPWIRVGNDTNYQDPQSTSDLPWVVMSYTTEHGKRKFFEVQELYPKSHHERLAKLAKRALYTEAQVAEAAVISMQTPAGIWFVASMIGAAVAGALMHSQWQRYAWGAALPHTRLISGV